MCSLQRALPCQGLQDLRPLGQFTKPLPIWLRLKGNVKLFLQSPSMRVYEWLVRVQRVVTAPFSSQIFAAYKDLLQILASPSAVHNKYNEVPGCRGAMVSGSHLIPPSLYMSLFLLHSLNSPSQGSKEPRSSSCHTPHYPKCDHESEVRVSPGVFLAIRTLSTPQNEDRICNYRRSPCDPYVHWNLRTSELVCV